MGLRVQLVKDYTPPPKARVLLVDDDADVLTAIGETLRHSGYRVTTFVKPAEAINFFAEDPSQFDVVIADEFMPDIKGSEVAERLVSIRTDIPVILITGGLDLEKTAERAQALGARIMMKPLLTEELEEAIERARKG